MRPSACSRAANIRAVSSVSSSLEGGFPPVWSRRPSTNWPTKACKATYATPRVTPGSAANEGTDLIACAPNSANAVSRMG